MTALPAVERDPRGVAAAPGIVTYLDLPLITRAGFVPAALYRGDRPAARPVVHDRAP